MLTREEAIKSLEDNCCDCELKFKTRAGEICLECREKIIELLKQQPEQPRREIVEISQALSEYKGILCNSSLARCNDGTLWIICEDSPWKKLPPIPQDDEVKDER